MKVIKMPQENDRISVEYQFEGDVVTAIIDGERESWDFTKMADGMIQPGPNDEPSISSDKFALCPVVDAERVNGELTVTVLNWWAKPQEQPGIIKEEYA